MLAAFDQSEFHGVKGRGSKILLPKASLLPLTEGCFIGSKAEATKSCFRGQIAAFDQSEFHWPMAEAAKQGKIQRMAASWKTSKMGS